MKCIILLLLLTICVSADTIVLDNGRSYNGHFSGPRGSRISFQDNRGVQYQFPVGDIQSLSFTQSGDTVTLGNGTSYWGQLTGPENEMIPFVDQQGIRYRFPTNEVSSLVFSTGWSGPYQSTGNGLVLPAGTEIAVMSNSPYRFPLRAAGPDVPRDHHPGCLGLQRHRGDPAQF